MARFFNGLNLILPTNYHLFASQNIYHLIVKSHCVPQGSDLGPFLFNIYLLPIFEIFNKYPDINQICLNCTESPTYFPDRFSNCISYLLKWLYSNSLKFIPNKNRIHLPSNTPPLYHPSKPPHVTSGNIVILYTKH